MAMASAVTNRTVVVVSSDAALRHRLRASLSGMRWHVRDARGGAEAMAELEEEAVEAVLVDAWLPDLEAAEFVVQLSEMYPQLEVLRMDGTAATQSNRSPRRHELLHAMRESLQGMGEPSLESASCAAPSPSAFSSGLPAAVLEERRGIAAQPPHALPPGIDELIGRSAPMLELARLIHLVAPRQTTVLIEGETGTGKEVVAKAVHRLSSRAQKPFVVLNCAAIPETLLEAELFGHTRGAFTGAVQSRMGRIEAAHGGTLFLDEIGEMPLALQAKMLRFLESGEIQRVGENDLMRVDVRVIAATHQPLEQRSSEGAFRLDLYHRLAVFPLDVPPLRERLDDVQALAEHFLAELGRTSPRKTLSAEAVTKLHQHDWPGNVRELAHVLERAVILAGDSPVVHATEIRMRRPQRVSG